jgi:hypothetical protein
MSLALTFDRHNKIIFFFLKKTHKCASVLISFQQKHSIRDGLLQIISMAASCQVDYSE